MGDGVLIERFTPSLELCNPQTLNKKSRHEMNTGEGLLGDGGAVRAHVYTLEPRLE